MIDVTIYVEKGDNLDDGGVYGFIFDEQELNCYRHEHDQSGNLDSPNNRERQLEGLAELLDYACDNAMLGLYVRTRSNIIRDAINQHNRRDSFRRLHRVNNATNKQLSRVLELCTYFDELDVELISGPDNMLRIAEGLANALWVYTDGSCLDNGRPYARAGAAIFFGPNHQLNKMFKVSGKQTNNRAEYTAIVKALETAISEHRNYLIIFTDCDLIIKTMNCYIHTWKNRGWRNAKGNPVENQDLVMRIDELMNKINYVKFEKVAAHSNSEYNNTVDRMAKQAANFRR